VSETNRAIRFGVEHAAPEEVEHTNRTIQMKNNPAFSFLCNRRDI